MEAEIANMTPEELDKYDESLKNYRNMYTTKDIIKDWKKEWKKEVAALSKDVAVLSKNNTMLSKDVAAKDKRIAELERQLGIVGTAQRQPQPA